MALVVTLTVGCGDLLEPYLGGDGPACGSSQTDQDLGGNWVLSGTGKRTGCTDSLFDADVFTLDGSFRMDQIGQDLELVGDPGGRSVDFAVQRGDVVGDCVLVDILEVDRRQVPAERIRTELVGAVQSDGSIRGTFTQDGPESCVAEGTFRIFVN